MSSDDPSLEDPGWIGPELDRKLAEADSAAAARDQRAAERDQLAADLDQEASDSAQRRGAGSPNYDRTRRTRSWTAIQRDISAQARSEIAKVRDDAADRRDRDAEVRDAAADERDARAGELDAQLDQLERRGNRNGGSVVGLEVLLGAARSRKRAAEDRERAAIARHEAARERALAREDRVRAAADRHRTMEEQALEGLDHLTGALRRGVGLAAIQRELDRGSRTGESLVVAFVDVNGLKAVNDGAGHRAGDELLSGVARCLQSGLRAYDVILRYGGDEFVCALSGQDPGWVRGRFAQIALRISAMGGAGITVGFAEHRAGESLHDLVARADQEMIARRRRS